MSEPTEQPNDQLEAAVDEMIDDAGKRTDVPEESLDDFDVGAPAQDAPAESEPEELELLTEVDEMVDSAQAASDPGDIDSLDSELADLADELLDGVFEDTDGNVALTTEELAQSESEDAPAHEEPATAEPAQEAPKQAEPEKPAAKEASAQKPEPKPEPASVAADASEPDEGAEEEPSRRAGLGRLVGAGVLPHAAKFVLVLNAPLEDRPKIWRDSVGWVALWTGFLALMIWLVGIWRVL